MKGLSKLSDFKEKEEAVYTELDSLATELANRYEELNSIVAFEGHTKSGAR